jgi:dienelactone hydrolase
MRRVVAIALFVTMLGATGCGGGPGRVAAPALGAATACVTPSGDAPVHRSQLAMARRSEITGARRALDPVVWAPARRGCAPPLILFSHGHYGDPSGCSRLCSALAASGFLVVAPHHPERGTPLNLQAAERDDDLASTLRQLKLRFDRRRIAVAGHSFGGRTAVELASLEPRVRAVITMAGGADRGTTASITAPTLMMAGGRDTVDPVRLSEASLRALPRTTPHGLLVVARAEHGGLIDGCAAIGACEQVARTASAFLLTYLMRMPGRDGPLKGLMSR